jgi:hypothetical protein
LLCLGFQDERPDRLVELTAILPDQLQRLVQLADLGLLVVRRDRRARTLVPEDVSDRSFRHSCFTKAKADGMPKVVDVDIEAALPARCVPSGVRHPVDWPAIEIASSKGLIP